MAPEKTVQSPDEEAVLRVMDEFHAAVPSKDTERLLAPCYRLGGAVRKRGNVMQIDTLEQLMQSIKDIPGKVDERFTILDVKIYEDLALVWAKNEVEIDGKLVSVGMNAIGLHKIEGEWKITSVVDTAKPPS